MHIEEQNIKKTYQLRFSKTANYRNKVWQTLCNSYFNNYINKNDTVLDLGCGYAEFINNIQAKTKFAMDLNPESINKVKPDVQFFEADCSQTWPIKDRNIDTIFSSNFLEHLPDKNKIISTIQEAHRCLKQNGQIILMGPNIKYLTGIYWDFFDHHIPLTERSVSELLETQGFKVKKKLARFLPYTLSNTLQYPTQMLKLYLMLPILWRIAGKQFLIFAQKT